MCKPLTTGTLKRVSLCLRAMRFEEKKIIATLT